MYNIEDVYGIFTLHYMNGGSKMPTKDEIIEYGKMYDEFEASPYNAPNKSLKVCLQEWQDSKNKSDDLNELKKMGLTYVNWFGANLDGYIYVGKNVKNGCPLIIYEEGSGMKVWLYGLGYLLNSGSTAFEDCIVYLHKRKSSIEAKDTLNVAKLLKERFKSLNPKMMGIGFSNGAQSLCNAEELSHIFDRLLLAGASPTDKFMKATNRAKTIVLCNNVGNIKNFDSVGRRTPAVNVEAYLLCGKHEALDSCCLTNEKFIRNFIDGNTKYSSATKGYIYSAIYKMDAEWTKAISRNLSKCKYK